MGGRYVLYIIKIPRVNLYKSVSDFGEQEVLLRGVPHAATPVTLTEGNPSSHCGRSLIVAMPDLEAGRDPRRKHRKDNAVRRSFCSFQLTVSFRRDQTKLAARKGAFE